MRQPAVQRRSTRRVGSAVLEIILFMASMFVAAMLLYWLGQAGVIGLYRIIAIYNGSPYL